jgi:hypothetical protein
MTNKNATLPVGLSAREIADRLRHAADAIGYHKYVLAFYLAEMERRRLYQVTGHGSTVHFGEAQLEMDARRTREYVQVGRTLQELALVEEALALGDISWSKVVALLPVVQRETQEAWVDFARQHTFRELRREVYGCRPGDLPGEGSDYGLIHKKIVIEAKLDDVTYAMFERARMMFSDKPDQLLDDAELIAELLRRALDGPPPSAPQPKPQPRKLLPEPERNTEEVPEEVLQHVRDRDQHACRNCRGPIGLHVHHIKPRAAGGNHAASNLILVCGTCHASVHRGFLAIHGNPESGPVRFTAADGTPVDRAPDQNGVRTPPAADAPAHNGVRTPPADSSRFPSSGPIPC